MPAASRSRSTRTRRRRRRKPAQQDEHLLELAGFRWARERTLVDRRGQERVVADALQLGSELENRQHEIGGARLDGGPWHPVELRGLRILHEGDAGLGLDRAQA